MSAEATQAERFRSLIKYANETPELLSLLYDMDLLPEQCGEMTHDWARMMILIEAWKQRSKIWCAMCGKFGDHSSGGCPELGHTKPAAY